VDEVVEVWLYARASRDRALTRRTVNRQLRDMDALALDPPWRGVRFHVAGRFVDNDRTAGDGGERPEWDALLAGVYRGEVTAIMAEDFKRLIRDVEQWGRFVNTCARRKRRVVLYFLRGGEPMVVDPARNPTALVQGTIEAMLGDQELRVMKVRSSQHSRRRREEGHLHAGGKRPYGYDRVDGEYVQRPAEAAVVRQVVEWVLDGWSLLRCARELNTRGERTVQGGAWTHSTVRHTLARPDLAGWVSHWEGEEGTRKHLVLDVRAVNCAEPILSLEEWNEVQAELARPERHWSKEPRHGGRRRPLLTGIVTDEHGNRLTVGPVNGADSYRTSGTGFNNVPAAQRGPALSARVAAVEGVVIDLVLRHCDRHPVVDPSAASSSGHERLRADLADVDERIATVTELYASKLIDKHHLRKRLAPLAVERDALLEELADVAVPLRDHDLALLRQPGALREWWCEGDAEQLDAQRRILRLLVDRVVLLPVGRGTAGRFDENRVRVVPSRLVRRWAPAAA
jgi:DNA invertase Pin-like site-specific DNA recombinase